MWLDDFLGEPKPWKQYLRMLDTALWIINVTDEEWLKEEGVLKLDWPSEFGHHSSWKKLVVNIIAELKEMGPEAHQDGLRVISIRQQEEMAGFAEDVEKFLVRQRRMVSP